MITISRKGHKHYTKEEEQLLLDNYSSMTYKQLAKLVNREWSAVYHKCRRLGLVQTSPELSRLKKGKLNGNWKGGISYLKSGYMRDNVANKNVHTVVMENELGRPLTIKEMVHHIDGIKSNNDLDNLVLCKDAADHRHLHCSLERAAFKLVQQGVIKFNKEKREYEL